MVVALKHNILNVKNGCLFHEHAALTVIMFVNMGMCHAHVVCNWVSLK